MPAQQEPTYHLSSPRAEQRQWPGLAGPYQVSPVCLLSMNGFQVSFMCLPTRGQRGPTSSGLPSSPTQVEWGLHSGCGCDPTYQNIDEVCGTSRLREEGSNGAPGPRAGAPGRVDSDGSSSFLPV